MAASYLGKALGDGVSITVLEAPAIPRIGVGEATVPNLHKTFFDFLGLAEEEWMREVNASFKIGIKFINWRTDGAGQAKPRPLSGDRTDHYYHLFGLLPNVGNIPLSHYWVHKKLAGQTDEPFDYACYAGAPVLDANLSPRFLDGRRWTNYAWHFDAALVADFLRRFAVTKLLNDSAVATQVPNDDDGGHGDRRGERLDAERVVRPPSVRNVVMCPR